MVTKEKLSSEMAPRRRKRYEVIVTEDILKHSTRNSSSRCALATAILEQIPGSARPSVDIQHVKFSLPALGESVSFETPISVIRYISRFDRGDRDIPPFTAYLLKPQYRPLQGHARRAREHVDSWRDVPASAVDGPDAGGWWKEHDLSPQALTDAEVESRSYPENAALRSIVQRSQRQGATLSKRTVMLGTAGEHIVGGDPTFPEKIQTANKPGTRRREFGMRALVWNEIQAADGES